jgi:hypothetical protein
MKQNSSNRALAEKVIPSSVDFSGISDPLGEIWVSVKELVEMGRGERKVQMKIASGEWVSRKRRQQGNRGRPMSEVALSSLPDDLQRRYLAFRRPEPSEAITNQPDETEISDTPDLDSLKADHRLNEVLKQFSTTEREAFLDEARRRMGIVERYIALPSKRWPVRGAYHFTPAVLSLCEETKCTNQVILDYYRSRQHAIRKGTGLIVARAITPRTLDNWSRRIKRDGLLTFLPAPSAVRRSDDKRRAQVSREAEEWIYNNWRSCAHARDLFQKLQKQARKHGWKIPSQTWCYRKWKALPKIVTVSRRSKKAYVDSLAPYYPRDYSDIDALQILVGDHSLRDVTVRLADGSLVRPWCSLWQCMRTGLIYGWHLDLTPSSRTIGLAYANGVKTFGAQPISRPDEDYYSYLYTDQGKDYKGHTIAGKQLTFKRAAAIEGGLGFLAADRRVGLIDDLGLKQILARGYNAREKPVERTHRDMSGWEQSMFDAEYCGRDAKNKPDAWRDAWARHERLLKKVQRTGSTSLLDESPFIQIDDYRDALGGYFADYNRTAHERSTLLGAKVVPIEEYQRLYTTHYTISEHTLALLLMKAEQRLVRKNGVSLFQQGFSYLHPDLAYYKGQYVEVRFSEDDYSRVFIVPPPTEAIPNPKIIEAHLVTRGGVLHPNKQTLAMISHQRKHEEKIIREHSLLTHSMIRGESAEDRVAAQFEPEVEEAEVAIAVGGGASGAGFSQPPARVHLVGRLDRLSKGRGAIRPVTVDQVANTQTDESIFEAPASGGVRMWDDEEEQ